MVAEVCTCVCEALLDVHAVEVVTSQGGKACEIDGMEWEREEMVE